MLLSNTQEKNCFSFRFGANLEPSYVRKFIFCYVQNVKHRKFLRLFILFHIKSFLEESFSIHYVVYDHLLKWKNKAEDKRVLYLIKNGYFSSNKYSTFHFRPRKVSPEYREARKLAKVFFIQIPTSVIMMSHLRLWRSVRTTRKKVKRREATCFWSHNLLPLCGYNEHKSCQNILHALEVLFQYISG